MCPVIDKLRGGRGSTKQDLKTKYNRNRDKKKLEKEVKEDS